jgi:integrase/recombinase XerD
MKIAGIRASMPRRPIPDPVIIPSSTQIARSASPTSVVTPSQPPTDLRQSRVDEFLMARSLSDNSKKAYQQDLQRFMDWTQTAWAAVTPRQVALFKDDLLEEKFLAPATVNRVLTTLKNFYGWMVDSEYVAKNPTKTIDLLELESPEAQDLSEAELASIYQVAAGSNYCERNTALVSILLHGLRAAEVSALNLEDYDGTRLHVRKAKSDSKGYVPLKEKARIDLDAYLEWRSQQGEELQPASPLFISRSRRSFGKRLTYWGIRDVVDAIQQVTGIDLHAHRFRHTFATDLVLRGMDTYHVMTLTRHKSIQSFKRYTKRADQIAAEKAFYHALGESKPENV